MRIDVSVIAAAATASIVGAFIDFWINFVKLQRPEQDIQEKQPSTIT